ncbi:MAG: hypothetical protein E7471_06200 [Ruminococcaceae bacterium]|nr:hypothetical protein [Oscillospiraceae bacterium]
MTKKQVLRNILIVTCAVVLVAVYLVAFFKPGVWHRNAFLYREADGVYSGTDEFAEYRLQVQGDELSFTVNDITRRYTVKTVGDAVTIREEETVLFSGKVLPFGDTYMLENENGELEIPITIIAGGVSPEESELFPNVNQLYEWAVVREDSVRGDFGALAVLLISALFLALDLIFPNLFFYLSHGLAVDGGEPSAFYRFGQTVSRILLGLLMVWSVFETFNRY